VLGGAGGSVELLLLLKLDDLASGHVRRHALGQLHHHHGLDREAGRDKQVG
jgi:hypothetical protein